MFVLHKPCQPSLMLSGKAGAYLIVEQLKCTFTWVGSCGLSYKLWSRVERPARDKHSSLLRKFSIMATKCKRNFSINIYFFVTNKITQKARVLHYTRLEKLAKDDNSNLLDPFQSNKESEVL